MGPRPIPHRAGEPALAAAHTEDEALYDRLGARHDTALKKLLCTPVPTAAELALKLDLTTAHQAWELTGGERCMAALQRDAWRLAGLRRRALAGAHRRDL